jgi:dolichol kinase
MDAGLAETGRIAAELHALLCETDPARFTESAAKKASERLARLRASLSARIERSRERAPTSLDRSLVTLDTVLREQPAPTSPALRGYWMTVRARLMPVYEHLAAQLRAREVQIPTLRPTNWARITFHVSSAAIALLLFEVVLGRVGSIWATAGFAAMCWTLEAGRTLSGRMNDVLMRFPFFRSIIHPHEVHRVNSATWYATALVVLAVLAPDVAAVSALAVLGLGDPAAGLVGRRWGRHVIHGGRTVEGTIAFVLAATVAAFAVLLAFHPISGAASLFAVASAAAVAGAIAEALAQRVDDNFLVPMGAGAAAWLTALALGVPLAY